MFLLTWITNVVYDILKLQFNHPKYGDVHVHDYDQITLDFFTGELHSYTSLLMHYSSYVELWF